MGEAIFFNEYNLRLATPLIILCVTYSIYTLFPFPLNFGTYFLLYFAYRARTSYAANQQVSLTASSAEATAAQLQKKAMDALVKEEEREEEMRRKREEKKRNKKEAMMGKKKGAKEGRRPEEKKEDRNDDDDDDFDLGVIAKNKRV
mmetsp:Transcript_19048/g.39200  ORF Transcript_19048/g.39200 Transcript_19048/m.39200 type:complete len:146 (+) Transcript_19048:383-820(+)